ncbi:hypothetical protein P3T76_002006 [Phytophthora citrophthora]|uniref:Uncharacterized protein n=1 Tax=Phytophthora citrophthora TaxID=4793 RepID=A0AAD9GYD6_9STRA|nr:hypothetical protein P3T76_002006 [Phytophthora citrophthora]
MKLQDDNVTLLDVRDIFDALIEMHPEASTYLGPDANIVKDPSFEEACVLVLANKTAQLAVEQEQMLDLFRSKSA